MTALYVESIPQLGDNYAYLLVCPETGKAGVVDCSEPPAVLDAIDRRGADLVAVLSTHHHWDHVGGNLELAARWPGLTIYGHSHDADRLPGLNHPLEDGDMIPLGSRAARILAIPAHTLGHIAYYFEEDGVVFPGDTLFGAGCGRLFEGTARQMTRALRDVLGGLPDETLVYCGHEYTASNIRFALTVEPNNEALRLRAQEVERLRARGEPTIPFTMADEWATNPFLRTDQPDVRRAAEQAGLADSSDPAAVLATIRTMKDAFPV